MNETKFTSGRENAIEWMTGEKTATVTITRQKIATRIRRLAEEYPDQVKILADGPENNGYLYAHIPSDWVRIAPPRRMSEEAKRKAAENLKRSVYPMENSEISREAQSDEEFFNEEE